MAKIAVITGASSGIGLATAKLFVKKGYKVYGIARKQFTCDEFYCYAADVCDHAATERVLKDIFEKEGAIDVFVNNAGFGIAGANEQLDADAVHSIVNVNLTAVMILCSQATPYLKLSRGRIINVSSVGGVVPLPYQAAYSATKSGVEIFSRALANELKRDKVKVCAVLPGDTNTGFTDARISQGDDKNAKRSIAKMENDERGGKSPLSVAKVIYKAAKKRNPPLRISTGVGSKLEVFLLRLLPVKLINFIVFKLYG